MKLIAMTVATFAILGCSGLMSHDTSHCGTAMTYVIRKDDGTLKIIGKEKLISPSRNERAALLGQVEGARIRDTGCWFVQPDGVTMKLKNRETGRNAIFKKEGEVWKLSTVTYPVEL